MPEELCRKCGESLHDFSFCVKCKEPIQRICSICKRQTVEQFHQHCVYQLEILRLFPIPPDRYAKYELTIDTFHNISR